MSRPDAPVDTRALYNSAHRILTTDPRTKTMGFHDVIIVPVIDNNDNAEVLEIKSHLPARHPGPLGPVCVRLTWKGFPSFVDIDPDGTTHTITKTLAPKEIPTDPTTISKLVELVGKLESA